MSTTLRASQILDDLLVEPRTQTTLLAGDLARAFGPFAAQRLLAWSRSRAEDYLELLCTPLQRRLDDYRGALEQCAGGSTPPAQKILLSYLQALDPRALAHDLQHGFDPTPIDDDFASWAGTLTRGRTAHGLLARRYLLPTPYRRALLAAVLTPLTRSRSAMEEHVAAMAELVAWVGCSDPLEHPDGTRVSTSAADGSTPVCYALGADPALQRIEERLQRSFTRAVNQIRSVATDVVGPRLQLTLLTLYGGVLLRLEQDLEPLGYSLHDQVALLDIATGAELAPSSALRSAIDEQCARTWTVAAQAFTDRAWSSAADLTERALVHLWGDRAWQRTEQCAGTSWVVGFVTLRLQALSAAAEEAWQSGQHAAASAIYRRLFSGCPLMAMKPDVEGIPAPLSAPRGLYLKALLRLLHLAQDGLDADTSRSTLIAASWLWSNFIRRHRSESTWPAGEGLDGLDVTGFVLVDQILAGWHLPTLAAELVTEPLLLAPRVLLAPASTPAGYDSPRSTPFDPELAPLYRELLVPRRPLPGDPVLRLLRRPRRQARGGRSLLTALSLCAITVIGFVAYGALTDARALHKLTRMFLHTEVKRAGWSELHSGLAAGDRDALTPLRERHLDLDARDPAGRPLLFHAWLRHDDLLLQTLIDAGADLKISNARGESLLEYAIRHQEVDAVRKILKLGADPNLRLSDGNWPLWLTISRNDLDTSRALLRAGARPEPLEQGESALHQAISQRNTDLVALLLDHGADPDRRDRSHATPLHRAVETGDQPLAELLFQHGARPNGRDRKGCTPLDRAHLTGQHELAMLLQSNGGRRVCTRETPATGTTDPNISPDPGDTPVERPQPPRIFPSSES